VSPTIPNPAAILRNLLLRRSEPWTITLPFMKGRLLGSLPERGDVVIVTPPGGNQDYIKRVIGLPGDTVEVRDGRLILNGRPVKAEMRPPAMIPVDLNSPCSVGHFYEDRIVHVEQGEFCRLPIVHETLPNGVNYDTIDDVNGSDGDRYAALKVPANHVFLMGDNRDHSADSRFSLAEQGLGGPVPVENIGGRAEFITFSLDGTTMLSNPATWFSAFREGRAGTSLRPARE
jgi:signal peptidase I